MCEQFVARAAEPFRLDVLWPLVEALERYGIAGFGWGASRLAPDGSLAGHRAARACRTVLYSVDRSLFLYAATGATQRGVARLQDTIALDERGHPDTTGTGRGCREGGTA